MEFYLASLVLAALMSGVRSDFRCVCNYAVETVVYRDSSRRSGPAGYLYEFDCKPLMEDTRNMTGFYGIQFEKKLRYVKKDKDVYLQICPGEPDVYDRVPTSSRPDTLVSAFYAKQRTDVTPTSTPTTQNMTTQTTETSSITMPVTSGIPAPVEFLPPLPDTHVTSNSPASAGLELTSQMNYPQTVGSNATAASLYSVDAHNVTPYVTSQTESSRRPAILYSTRQTSSQPRGDGTASVPLGSTISFTDPESPLRIIGVGYNLLQGNPDSDVITKGHPDPGLLRKRPILEISLTSSLSAREVVYQYHNTCIPTSRATLIYSGKSYQDYLLNYATPDGHHSADVIDRAFALNKDFRAVVQSTSPGQWSVYKDISTSCSTATVRYLEDRAATDRFSVSPEFAQAVCSLPVHYDQGEYMGFIDQWGTSIVMGADLGTRATQRFQSTLARAFEDVRSGDPGLILHSGPYKGATTSLTVDTDRYVGSKVAHAQVGSLLFAHAHGSNLAPEPIRLRLAPLTLALHPKYWGNFLEDQKPDSACPGGVTPGILYNYTAYINTALSRYVAYSDTLSLQAQPLQLPVMWPSGTYGLMKARGGCPHGGTRWMDGWRRQDTEDKVATNQWSPGIDRYLSGVFNRNNLQTSYCIKPFTSTSPFDLPWPKGTYCLYKFGRCPTGFSIGSIFWDDEDVHNSNRHWGTLPEGSYGLDTRINFCCRSDGLPNAAITLPVDKPFVLLRYGHTCQTVFSMRHVDVFLRWDDEDLANKDSSWGAYPDDDGGRKDHKLHFCYYERESPNGIDMSSVIG